MTSITYTLTDDECAMLDHIARKRNEQKRQFMQSIGKNYDPKASNVATHRLGIGAEYAVAQVLRSHWDDRVLRGGNKRGWDVDSPVGTIDVKYRRQIGWAWTTDSLKLDEFKADWGVLVYPVSEFVAATRNYWIIGAVSRADFQRYAQAALDGHGHEVQVENWGYGPRCAMRAGHMLPFFKLVEMAHERRAA